jgi:uncharacterized DUF497 family protein
MRFEWDENKRLVNIRKTGSISLESKPFFMIKLLLSLMKDLIMVKTRFLTLGLLKGRVVVIAHTQHNSMIRIISVRKALKYEQIQYFQNLAD